MVTPLACPNVTALERLVLGHLEPDEITRVQDHLAACPDCLARVGALATDDPLERAMRAPAAAGPEDAAVAGLIARLRGAGSLSGLGSTETFFRDAAGTAGETLPDSYPFLAPPDAPDELGRLGPYRVRRVLGSGGMGIVFEAEDPQLQRPVALKVMRPGMARRPDAGSRFLHEARATAAIQHDHIVTIHQVGEDGGVPYLAMQLLQGETLESRLQRLGRRPAVEVVRLGRQIARGLAVAHARGLVHRDVKPSNIWIEASAGTGPAERVKLLDFGLAQAAAGPAGGPTPGLLAGTPAYMAPEQAAGGPIDHRCDLFGLGCVLYRMCTGELPFKGEKPLTVLWAAAVQDPVPPRQLSPEVPAALSDLILRLLAKDPAERPQSAREVGDVLGAIDLSGPRPPAPSPAPPRRRRVLAAVAVAAVVLLAVGGTLYGPTLYRFGTNRGQIVIVIDADDPDVKVLIKDKEQSRILDPKADREVTLKAGDYHVELVDARLGQRLSASEITLNRGGRQVVSVGWAPPGPLQTLTGHQDFVWSARFCLGGTHVVSGGGSRIDNGKWLTGSDFVLRLWDVKTGREVARLADHTEIVRCVAVSPGGRRAVSVGGDRAVAGGKDFALRLWDLEGKKLIRHFAAGHTDRVNSVAFAADGKRVVSASDDRTVRLWDVETGREVRSFTTDEAKAVWSADISGDGTRVLSGEYDAAPRQSVLRVWDARTGDLIKSLRVSDMPLGSVTFAAGGRRALTQDNNTARLWDLDTGKRVVAFTGHRGWLGRLAISPDGRRILSGGADMTVRLWDAATGTELHRFTGHEEPVYDIAFSPDGHFAVSASWDKTVRIWMLGDSAPRDQNFSPMMGD